MTSLRQASALIHKLIAIIFSLQAQAIMLLAGEISLAEPIAQEMPTTEVRTPCQSNSPSLHKLKAGIEISSTIINNL